MEEKTLTEIVGTILGITNEDSKIEISFVPVSTNRYIIVKYPLNYDPTTLRVIKTELAKSTHERGTWGVPARLLINGCFDNSIKRYYEGKGIEIFKS